MKITVDQSMFRDAFQRYDRIDNFSYQGLNALFDYLDDLDSGNEEETELDVIAICSDFSEHDSALEAAKEYSPDVFDNCEDEDPEKAALVFLQDNTTVIQVDGRGVIVASF
jgi:hypothetical protein